MGITDEIDKMARIDTAGGWIEVARLRDGGSELTLIKEIAGEEHGVAAELDAETTAKLAEILSA